MEYTEKLHLNLPGDSDLPDISKLSENFRKIAEYLGGPGEPYKVGDILSTYRTDLGEDWLLCNGETFDPAEYPALAEITPPMSTMIELTRAETFSDVTASKSPYVTGAATDGMKTAVLTGSEWLVVSSDGFHTAQNYLISGLGAYSRIFYVNGQWVIADQYTGSSDSTIRAFYTADNPEGPWEKHALQNTTGLITHMEYLNGFYWVFLSSGIYGSFPNFDITTFSKNTILKPTSTIGCEFVRTDRFTFVCTSKANTIYLVSADNPAGFWETSAAITVPNPYTYKRYKYISTEINPRALWFDGKIVGHVMVSGHAAGISSNTKFANQIYIIEGGTAYTLDAGDFLPHEPVEPPSVLFARGEFLVLKSNCTICVADETGGRGTIETGFKYNGDYNTAIIEKGECLFFGASSDSSAKLAVTRVPLYGVPAIAAPQSHAYIKAK